MDGICYFSLLFCFVFVSVACDCNEKNHYESYKYFFCPFVFSYCLSVFTLEIPEVWNCESCLSGNDRISTQFAGKEDSLSSSTDIRHSRKLSGPRKVSVSGWKLHSKRQKPVETGKVKFLSQEEVVKLSSGASTKTGSPRKTASAFMSRKTTPTKPKSVNPKFFPERVEKATPPTPSRLMKPGGFNRISMSNQQASRSSKEPKGDRSFRHDFIHNSYELAVIIRNEHVDSDVHSMGNGCEFLFVLKVIFIYSELKSAFFTARSCYFHT